MSRSGNWLGTGAQQNHLSQSERWKDGMGGASTPPRRPQLKASCTRRDVLIRKHISVTLISD